MIPPPHREGIFQALRRIGPGQCLGSHCFHPKTLSALKVRGLVHNRGLGNNWALTDEGQAALDDGICRELRWPSRLRAFCNLITNTFLGARG